MALASSTRLLNPSLDLPIRNAQKSKRYPYRFPKQWISHWENDKISDLPLEFSYRFPDRWFSTKTIHLLSFEDFLHFPTIHTMHPWAKPRLFRIFRFLRRPAVRKVPKVAVIEALEVTQRLQHGTHGPMRARHTHRVTWVVAGGTWSNTALWCTIQSTKYI